MRSIFQPPLASWKAMIRPWDNQRPLDLLNIISANHTLLGSGKLPDDPASLSQPLWVTGHQAWLWHPGILAKDMAVATAASHHGGSSLHLVVDHDTHEALQIQLPVLKGKQLKIHTLTLAPTRADIPSACQPPADLQIAIQNISQAREQLGSSLAIDAQMLDTLAQAIASVDDMQGFQTLGQQMAALTAKVLEPWTGAMPLLLTSQLSQLEGFSQIVKDMLADAANCATAYNRAVLAHPQAGIGPLAMDRQFIELPLWLLTWQGHRQAVYADITDHHPLLVTADGMPVPDAALPGQSSRSDITQPLLAPKAMLLTAVIRRYYASVFIHGTGGGVYDQGTEAWWNAWRNESSLAPMAVATADLRLPFDAPVATAADVRHAQWLVHHLPHNLDRQRELSPDAKTLAQAKQKLLGHMHDDRDISRRARAFKEIHAINNQLALLMPDVLAAASQNLRDASAGRGNHSIAMKRDWPFVIYQPELLSRLATEIRHHADSPSANLASNA